MNRQEALIFSVATDLANVCQKLDNDGVYLDGEYIDLIYTMFDLEPNTAPDYSLSELKDMMNYIKASVVNAKNIGSEFKHQFERIRKIMNLDPSKWNQIYDNQVKMFDSSSSVSQQIQAARQTPEFQDAMKQLIAMFG